MWHFSPAGKKSLCFSLYSFPFLWPPLITFTLFPPFLPPSLLFSFSFVSLPRFIELHRFGKPIIISFRWIFRVIFPLPPFSFPSSSPSTRAFLWFPLQIYGSLSFLKSNLSFTPSLTRFFSRITDRFHDSKPYEDPVKRTVKAPA